MTFFFLLLSVLGPPLSNFFFFCFFSLALPGVDNFCWFSLRRKPPYCPSLQEERFLECFLYPDLYVFPCGGASLFCSFLSMAPSFAIPRPEFVFMLFFSRPSKKNLTFPIIPFIDPSRPYFFSFGDVWSYTAFIQSPPPVNRHCKGVFL